jgi:hypothetical protein
VQRSKLAAPHWATALLICLALAAGPARAEDRGNVSALDLVYEASDAIDAARDEIDAGRQREADRLLNRAERFLDEASRLAPDLRRVSFERARLLQIDGDPSRAEGLLIATMYRSMEPPDHVRAVAILEDIRSDLGKVTVGAQWRQATAVRSVGIATVAAGAVLSVIGFGVGFDALAQDTYGRVDAPDLAPDLAPREAGLAVGLVGAGIAGVGGGFTLAGEFGRKKLRAVLPGPWRLPGGRLETGSAPPAKKDTERPNRGLR